MGRGSKSKALSKQDISEEINDATNTVQGSQVPQEMELDEEPDKSDAVGSGESLKHLGRGVKELVQAVQALRHLGVEDLVLPLPKIVVVGDQSAGKSSLVEAMSEIKVPRSTDQQWSCRVSVHKKYMYVGKAGTARTGKNVIKSEGASRAKPLGSWVIQESEFFHFATINTASEVPDVLHSAQLAVLNPGEPYTNYAYTPGQAKQQASTAVKFSPNVIRLDITGPGLPNLSFYDLPGVINVPDVPEEAYLVDVVKNLVKEYITQQDCINLLAMSMTDDPANSSASRLIREFKAEGRTLGCLTKPDRLQEEESLDQWIQILRGERFRLGHGYHVIKNNPDTSVPHSTAREEEARFFQQKIWATTLKGHSQKFGSLNLQATLSQLLTAQITESLPKIYANVQQKAREIDLALKNLPEPLSGNLAAIVRGELMEFNQELTDQIDGGSGNCTFQKDIHTLAENFRDNLGSLRPIAMLTQPHQHTPQQSHKFRNPRASGVMSTPNPAMRANMRAHIDLVDSESEDDQDSEGQDKNPSISASSRKRPPPSSSGSQSHKIPRTENLRVQPGETNQAKRFSLLEVRDIIKTTYMGLPDQVHPRVAEKMIKMSTGHWFEPTKHFLDQTKSLCERMIEDTVRKVFSHRQSTGYFYKLLEHCGNFLEQACEDQLRMAGRLLAWEQDRPRTLDQAKMSKALQEAKSVLYERRRYWRARDYLDQLDQKSSNRPQDQNRDERIKRISEDELPAEQFGPELDTLAEVRAYYDCASSRFVDSVFLSVNYDVLRKVRDDLVDFFIDRIGLMEEDTNSNLAELLAAQPEEEIKRNQLKKERQTIRSALEELENVVRHAGKHP